MSDKVVDLYCKIRDHDHSVSKEIKDLQDLGVTIPKDMKDLPFFLKEQNA